MVILLPFPIKLSTFKNWLLLTFIQNPTFRKYVNLTDSQKYSSRQGRKLPSGCAELTKLRFLKEY